MDNFDRGRQTSLHLFEHVHGNSRDRGPALIDLMQTYEKAGLQFNADELPDHLPVVLEFASTQPPEVAKEFLGEMAHILNALFSALVARNSPYASVIAAVLEVSGQRVQSVALRLVCEREAEIEAFRPREYWTVEAHLAVAAPRARPSLTSHSLFILFVPPAPSGHQKESPYDRLA